MNDSIALCLGGDADGRPDAEAGGSSQHAYPAADRDAIYRVMAQRRDMRHFTPGAQVVPEVLERLLLAAHAGPSVGFMQPWRFLRISDAGLRERIHGCVERERVATARALGEREEDFLKLKVEGIREAAELIAVCLADGRERHVFGRRTMPYMDIASVGCALQNLWLAARAEGLGVGWVSIFDPDELGALLQLPEGASPLALLCIGPVPEFYDAPMLQQQRWASRMPLADVVFDNTWGQSAPFLQGLCQPGQSPMADNAGCDSSD